MPSSDTATRPLGLADEGLAARAGAGRHLAIVLALAGLFLFFSQQAAIVAEALRLAFFDNDDAMRLQQVRDLLAGQDWFDLTQYRFLPPEGVAMHWSRLVDVPVALGMLTLAPLTGAEWAEKIVVAAWPLLLFVGYAGLIGWGSYRLFGPLAAGMAVFVIGQMVVVADVFAAGRIDHHNVQIILLVGAVLGFAASERGSAGALASGMLCGASLAIGLETLPFVAAISMTFALDWVAHGEVRRHALVLFGASFAAIALVAFWLQTSPSLWLVPACDALSLPWLSLTTGGGLVALALAYATPHLRSWQIRLTAALGGATVLAIALAATFPTCLEGPYQMVPQPFREIWLSVVTEALPFRRFLKANSDVALAAIMPVLLAALLTTAGAWREQGHRRAFLGMLAGLLWLAAMLAQFQVRTLYMACAFLPLAGGWFLSSLVSEEPAGVAPAARAIRVASAFLMFGLPWALGGAFLANSEAATAKPAQATPCRDPLALEALNVLPAGTVLAERGLGAMMLVHTPHSIAAAGYHRAPSGIVGSIQAFSGDEPTMRRVAADLGADYIVICEGLRDARRDGPRPFAKDLLNGGSAAWLEPLRLPEGPLRAWRVLP